MKSLTHTICQKTGFPKGIDVIWNDREPVCAVNWYEALLFCNRRSDAHGLPKYYEFDEESYDWTNRVLTEAASFPRVWAVAGRGYRFPTDREWE